MKHRKISGRCLAFPQGHTILYLQGKVWLIDFNPFGEVTDSLLFTWEELMSSRDHGGDASEQVRHQQMRGLVVMFLALPPAPLFPQPNTQNIP